MWVQMSAFFVSQPSYYPIIFQHSHSARFFPIILSIIKAIAPAARHVAGCAETVHCDVKRDHQSLCRFVEAEHGLQEFPERP